MVGMVMRGVHDSLSSILIALHGMPVPVIDHSC